MNKIKLVIPLIFFLALAIPVHAYTKGNSQFNINYNLVIDEIVGVEYTPYCLAECHLPINFSYSGSLALSSKDLSLSDLSWTKTKIIGFDNLNAITMNYLANVTYQDFFSNVICETKYTLNSTPYQNCVEKGYWFDAWKYVWKPLTSVITAEKDKNIVIDFVGYRKAQLGFSSIDVVPTIYGYSMPEYQTWNSSYSYKCSINNTNNNRINQTVELYLSQCSGFSKSHVRSDCADVELINSSETGTIPFDIVACNSTDVGIVTLQPSNTSVQVGWVYYGYSADSVQSETPLRMGYDNFNDNSINASFWTKNNGCGSATFVEQNGIFNQTGTSITDNCAYVWYANSTITKYETVYAKTYYIASGTDSRGGVAIGVLNLTTSGNNARFWGRTYNDIIKVIWGDDSTAWGTAVGANLKNAMWVWLMAYSDSSNNYGREWNYTANEPSINTRSETWAGRNGYLGLQGNGATGYLQWDEFQVWAVGYQPTFYASEDKASLVYGAETSTGNSTAQATSIQLWLNNTQANLTGIYPLTLNSTALINTTGLWVAILKNNTLIANGTTTTQNVTLWSAGNYNITAYYVGNATYSSSSTTYFVIINPLTSNLQLTNNISWSGTYPNPTNTTGSGCAGGAACNLYRNGSSVSNSDLIKLGAGTYNYTFNVSNNANYSANSTSSLLTISPATSTITLTITPSSPITYSTPIIANCSGNNPEGATIKLYRNGTDVTSAENGTSITLGVGGYNYTCNSTATGNYTSATTSQNYIVSAAPSIVNLWFDSYQNQNIVVDVGTNVMINASSSGATVYWYQSSNAESNFLNLGVSPSGNSTYQYINATRLGLNTSSGNYYVFKVNATGSSNYSTNSTGISYKLNYTASPPTGVLNIPVVYDEKTLTPLTFNLSIYNASYSETTNNINNYSNSSVGGAITITISAVGYVPRNYYLNILNSTAATTLYGYLLKSTEGVYISYWVYSNNNYLGEPFSLMYIYRFLNSSWIDISESKSDVEGKGAVFLDPYSDYKINVESADGSLYKNYSSYSPNPSFLLKVNLRGLGMGGVNYTWLFQGVNYSLTPTDVYLRYNITTFTYTISAAESDIEWYALKLIYNNGTTLYFSNQTNPTGGDIAVNLNYTNLNGYVTAQTFLKRTGYDIYSWNRTFIIWETQSAIPDALNYLKNSSGLPVVVLSLIALFCSFGIAMISNRVVRTGSGIIYLAVLTIFTLYGLFGSNPAQAWSILIGLYLMEAGILMYREVW